MTSKYSIIRRYVAVGSSALILYLVIARLVYPAAFSRACRIGHTACDEVMPAIGYALHILPPAFMYIAVALGAMLIAHLLMLRQP